VILGWDVSETMKTNKVSLQWHIPPLFAQDMSPNNIMIGSQKTCDDSCDHQGSYGPDIILSDFYNVGFT
jgi:hypothetical protein